MNRERTFVLFRTVLAAVLLYASVRTAIPELAHGGHRHPHLLVLGSVEALGALLLFLRRTRTAGSVLLLLTIAIAFLFHALRGEVRPELLVYAAGVVFVLAEHHGTTRGAGAAPPASPA